MMCTRLPYWCVFGLLACGGSLPAATPGLFVQEAEAKKAALEKPAPAYPIVARQLKVSGSVAVEATVGEDGTVQDVKILTGNPLLTKPVAEAVKKWRFRPFQAEGKAVMATVSLNFEFGTR